MTLTGESLDVYLTEIGRHRLLDKDEERQLARLLVGGRVVRRRRTRKAALARFLRNRD